MEISPVGFFATYSKACNLFTCLLFKIATLEYLCGKEAIRFYVIRRTPEQIYVSWQWRHDYYKSNLHFLSVDLRRWETTPRFEVGKPPTGGQWRFYMQRVAPQHRHRCESTSRRAPSAVLRKKRKVIRRRLWKVLESRLNDIDMAMTEVNGPQFFNSPTTMRNDPVDYRTNARTKG